ncbi:reverse transcriptase domain-containing protein [Deferrisoma sp.]
MKGVPAGRFDRLCSFEHLHWAFGRARRGKAGDPGANAFFLRLEEELWTLSRELRERAYRPGPYREFWVYDRKPRKISAAPFRDRVVHHALVGVLEPAWERRFQPWTYANRKGRGTHAAVRRVQAILRRHPWVLQFDVRKYFPSIDHALLKGLLAEGVDDGGVLWLCGRIIDGSNPQEPVLDHFPGDGLFTPLERRKGLPIGNQTSQFFGNVYLDPLDRFLARDLGRRCARYVDDVVVGIESPADGLRVLAAVDRCLEGLRLRVHPTRRTVGRSEDGVRFVGYRVFSTHLRLPKENVRRARRRMVWLRRAHDQRRATAAWCRASWAGWLGHALPAASWHARRSVALAWRRGP